MQQHKLTNAFLIIVAIQMVAACSKMIETPPPVTQITTLNVFQTETTANAAVAGLFRSLRDKAFFSNGPTLLTGFSGDELTSLTVQTQLDPFQMNNIPTNSEVIAGVWSGWYYIIYQANAILEGLQNSPIDAETIKMFRGEALWMRAYSYLFLVNLFGEVPLILTTEVKVSSTLPRTAVAEIYTQISKDAMEAVDQTPVVNKFANNEKIRINKAVATALLARIYLYQGKWTEAEALSSSLLSGGAYQLLTDISGIMQKNNPEAIFQLANNSTGDFNAEPTNYFLVTTPVAVVTSALFNSFEMTDLRKQQWLRPLTYLGKNYAVPYKYRITNAPTSEYYTLFRLAEQVLIRAEARAWQNKLTGSNSAVSDLNLLRLRSGLSPLTLTDQASILAAVENERQKELFAEPGHRWFDLKRTGHIDAVMTAVKGNNWQTTDALYPLPLSEVQKNIALRQNPGY